MKYRQANDTQYHYNAHRLDSVSYDDALTTIYHYDQYGRVDSLYDESGVVCYQYGNMGEITKETRIYALPFLLQPIALTTQFRYDSWGRVDSIFYPDGERLKYQYDLGGQLQSITNNSSYTYLDNVAYDRFGAKVSQTYGNGLKTNYSYNNLTRRLSTITTLNGNSQISTFAYTYDPVGNVTQVTSSCPWRNNQTFTESFTYDAADQLTAAQSVVSGQPSVSSYQLAVTYGNWGKISSYGLTQRDMQHNTTQSEAQAYSYPVSGSLGDCQTLFAPEQRTITDANNNVATETLAFGINGSLRRRDVQAQNSFTEYYLFNSAANLKAYSNNGLDFAYYGYNASNTRTYKLNFLNANSWVNGQQLPIHPQSIQAMFYPNTYLNFNQNGEYTKHYYNGSERIASRLGNTALSISMEMTDRLQERVGKLETRFQNDIQTLVYTNVQVETPPVSATSLQQTGTPTDIFYYHTNHLGSTAYVTDNNAIITQGFLYAPFGEITTEYNANFYNNVLPKYSFNAKELDEETGMYYYEARYYKPPVFTSRDPMFEKYFWMTPYAYCANNPVKYVDPSGRSYSEFDENGNYLQTIKDNWWHNTFIGRRGRVVDSDGNVLQIFKFADPKNDTKDLKEGRINRVQFVQEIEIIKMLSYAGAFDMENKNYNNELFDRYDYILKEGKGGGHFDFASNGIPYIYDEPSKSLFLIDGVAHNYFNYGNFLFGAAGKAIGMTLLELKIGAHGNSFANPETNGYERQPDSEDDQYSIKMGVRHAKENNYMYRYYKVSSGPLEKNKNR